jgi:phosphonate transport system substrate-binding protein
MKLPFCNVAPRLMTLLWLVAGLSLTLGPVWAEPNNVPIRVGLPTSMFFKQYALASDWGQYLESKLNRPVQLVMNRKFSDTGIQLYVEKLDFAWVTDYPDYADSPHLESGVRLLAVPLYKGEPYFTSYLIVPAFDDKTTSLMQLRGAIFAFTDPNPNGSNLEVNYELLKAGVDPAHFFHKIIYTQSHREVIQAVALGIVHAGEVSGPVWDALAKSRPDLAAKTRIVAKTPVYGAPPIVANHFVSKEHFNDMQRVLMGMATDPNGIALLKRLNIDGFIPGDKKIYSHIIQMRRALGEE